MPLAQESDTGIDIDGVAPTINDDRAGVEKGAKEMKLNYPCWLPSRRFAHWLGSVSVEIER